MKQLNEMLTEFLSEIDKWIKNGEKETGNEYQIVEEGDSIGFEFIGEAENINTYKVSFWIRSLWNKLERESIMRNAQFM